MIHSSADVQSKSIGKNTLIWQYAIILPNAIIGDFCNINCHTFIENDVIIGDHVTLKSGVYLWDGIEIENYVFIGPNVTFTNDARPRSKIYPSKFIKTLIKKYASIGAGATILGGITIGEYAMVGAGALVTKDIPPRALVIGSPAKIVGWLNDDGTNMKLKGSFFIDQFGQEWNVDSEGLKKV